MAKILFLQEIWFELQGIMQLSAALKKSGHTVDIIIGKDKEKMLEEIKAYNPDIVAISMLTSYRQYALNMAKFIKENNIPAVVFVGGYDASFFPQTIEQCNDIDVLCIGEGDEPMIELANIIDNALGAMKRGDDKCVGELWIGTKEARKCVSAYVPKSEDLSTQAPKHLNTPHISPFISSFY